MKTVLLYLLLTISYSALAQQTEEANPSETEVVQNDDSTIDEEESNQEEAESEIEEPNDSDFKPDDEISEDYPVSLPSDI